MSVTRDFIVIFQRNALSINDRAGLLRTRSYFLYWKEWALRLTQKINKLQPSLRQGSDGKQNQISAQAFLTSYTESKLIGAY